jgi:hypothetical protein
MTTNSNMTVMPFRWPRLGECSRMAAMTESARSRGFIALIAAYAVALQALLLPLSVAAGAQSSGLCLSAASNGQPAGDQSGCPCAAGCGLQCCAQTSLLPPQITITRAVAQIAVLLAPYAGEQFPPAHDFESHHPRGPPAA